MAGQTIRITIKRDDKTMVVLTGTSYKHWIDQAVEYIYRNFGDKNHGWHFSDIEDLEIEVEHSFSKWKSWGGLKWCIPELFQGELNREGVQQNEPDNPKPRQYKDFKFTEYNNNGLYRLMKELRKW